MALDPEALRGLVHDVNAKCSTLKSAVALLGASSDKDARELLALMAEQAKSLAKLLAEKKEQWG